jgi:hypothetical protein
MLNLLEQGGICRQLVFFLNYPDGIVRSKYRRSSLKLSPRAADRNHLALFNANLIETKPHPSKLLFVLTEKGKNVATKLKEIEEILNDGNF